MDSAMPSPKQTTCYSDILNTSLVPNKASKPPVNLDIKPPMFLVPQKDKPLRASTNNIAIHGNCRASPPPFNHDTDGGRDHFAIRNEFFVTHYQFSFLK